MTRSERHKACVMALHWARQSRRAGYWRDARTWLTIARQSRDRSPLP
jgi:hypothetical protein